MMDPQAYLQFMANLQAQGAMAAAAQAQSAPAAPPQAFCPQELKKRMAVGDADGGCRDHSVSAVGEIQERWRKKKQYSTANATPLGCPHLMTSFEGARRATTSNVGTSEQARKRASTHSCNQARPPVEHIEHIEHIAHPQQMQQQQQHTQQQHQPTKISSAARLPS